MGRVLQRPSVKGAMEEAAELIEQDDVEWHDFCANHGHIPDNVKHMPTIRAAFAQWLEDNNQE